MASAPPRHHRAMAPGSATSVSMSMTTASSPCSRRCSASQCPTKPRTSVMSALTGCSPYRTAPAPPCGGPSSVGARAARPKPAIAQVALRARRPRAPGASPAEGPVRGVSSAPRARRRGAGQLPAISAPPTTPRRRPPPPWRARVVTRGARSKRLEGGKRSPLDRGVGDRRGLRSNGATVRRARNGQHDAPARRRARGPLRSRCRPAGLPHDEGVGGASQAVEGRTRSATPFLGSRCPRTRCRPRRVDADGPIKSADPGRLLGREARGSTPWGDHDRGAHSQTSTSPRRGA